MNSIPASTGNTIRAVLHLQAADQEEDFFLREESTVQIGRGEENDIPLESNLTSKRHAVLAWQAGTFELRDLGSRNGTLLNDQLCQAPVLLQEGDVIGIGVARLTFRLIPAEEAMPAPYGTVDVVEPEVIMAPELVVCADTDEARTLTLTGDNLIIGRSGSGDKFDLSLTDGMVSRPHASLSGQNGVYRLKDLNSRNGSFVNGGRITSPTVLKDGDVILLGGTTLLFRLPEALKADQEPRRPFASLKSVPTDEVIQAVVDQQELIRRNLQITLNYHRLSLGMREVVSADDLNWCCFGVVASKTAGQVLRHELLPRPLKSAMIRAAGYENTGLFFYDALGHGGLENLDDDDNSYLAKVLKRLSLLVSAGNIAIFSELSPLFAKFIRTFADSQAANESAIQRFLSETFRPGRAEVGGQDHLIEAFRAYYRARFETDRKRKTELIFLANILSGLHEQIRVQRFIEESLALPVDLLFEAHMIDRQTHEDRIADLIRKQARGISRQVMLQSITQMLMFVWLPTRKLKLGENVVAPTGVTASFPRDLLTLEDPRLRQVVGRFDVGLNTVSGSAANDWANLRERMTFIMDFFRSHQKYMRLYDPPFLESQIADIDANQVPGGPL